MNRLAAFLFACLIACTALVAEETPDWAKRDFAAPASQVYVAALRSIARQHHDREGQTENTSITFHVGATAWSLGYNMELTLTPIDERHTHVVIGISRSGGKTFSWGSGQKEVRKIFDGIDSDLAENKSEETPTFSGAAHMQDQAPAGDALVLHDGQLLVMRITHSMSSETAQPGQEIQFEVIAPVKIGDLVVVPEGAIATGKVVAVEKKERKGRGGMLSIAIESVQLATGETARLRASETRANGTNKRMVSDMAGWTFYTAGLGAPLIPFFLLEHGEEMIVPVGSRFTARFDGDISLDREAVIQTQSRAPVPNADLATVYLYRPPDNTRAPWDPPITCGEALVGVFRPSQFQRLQLTPGKYWFHGGPETGKVLAKAHKANLFADTFEAGHTYYVELWVRNRHTLTRDWNVIFRSIASADGEKALLEVDSRVDLDVASYTAQQQSALGAQPPSSSPH